MNPRTVFFLSLIFGVAAIAITFSIYFFGGGFEHEFSQRTEDWGSFGSYLSGVLGSLFGFASFILLLVTVLQQEKQIEKVHEDGLKQNHINYMNEIHGDIRYLLQRRIKCKDGNELEFGEFCIGSAQSEPKDKEIFRALIPQLLKYVAEYSNALHLYRGNFDRYFQYKAHEGRIRLLAEFIKKHEAYLTNMEPVTLGIIFHNLDGESLDA